MVHRQPVIETENTRLRRLRKLDTSRLSDRVRPRIKPRGVPAALADHLVYATTDVLQAEMLGRPLFGPHRLRPTDDPGGFAAAWHAVRFRDVTLGHLDYGTPVEVVVEAADEHLVVLTPLNGTCSLRSARGSGQGSPIRAVVPGDGPFRLSCDHQTSLLVVVVEQQTLVGHLSRLLGRALDQPLVFDLELDLADPVAYRWNLALQMLQAELFEPHSLLHRGVGIGPLEDFVMSSLLCAHPSTYSQELNAAPQSGHRVTRVAKDYIETHLGESLGVAAIASAAGVSVRTLESAFHIDLHITPTTYIHQRRLERVRADLADAGPGVTVTAVALRWGVGHLSRFAHEYRARFGETPSQTLRN